MKKKSGSANAKTMAEKKKAMAKQISASGKLAAAGDKKRLLHIEVGPSKTALHSQFTTDKWKIYTVNIHKDTPADFHLHPLKLEGIADGSFDAIWSNHTLKFFYTTEIPFILKEFHRVLKTDGFLHLATLNLKRIADIIGGKGLEAPVYSAKAGDICGIDALYGFRGYLKQGALNQFVAPKTGFSSNYLGHLMQQAGFRNMHLTEDGINIYALGYKREKDTTQNKSYRITPLEIMKIMEERDQMDKPPEIWPTKEKE